MSILALPAHVDINAFYSFCHFADFRSISPISALAAATSWGNLSSSYTRVRDSSADNASIIREHGFSFYQGKVAELSAGTRNQPRVRVSGLIENRCKSGSAKKASRRESGILGMIRFPRR